MKQTGESYWCWRDGHINCRDLLVLQDLLCTQFVPHFESPQFNNMVAECKEIFAGIVKNLESKAIEFVEDSEPEPEVDKPKPEQGIIVELVSL